MNKKTVKIAVIAGVIIAAVVLFWKYPFFKKSKEAIFCTMDAKVCPDGSAVGRVPPDCEFSPCPEALTGIANPASENCVAKGGRVEIRKNSDASEYGVCVFSDETECEEWALFRGECVFGGK